jgi:two-component system, OmpR family, phosphate regulon sensor histidine kinase PhoR
LRAEDENDAGARAARSGYEIRLEDVLARLPRGVIVVQPDLQIAFVNPAARRLLEGVVPLRRGEPLPADTDDAPLRTFARDLFEDAAPPVPSLTRIGERTVRVEGIPSNGSNNVVLVVEDVTERERARIAEHEFVENAAHELRTPLAAIVSVVEALDAGAKDDPHARDRFLAHLRRHSERLVRLATSLLALARVQTGQQEPRLELVAITPLLEAVAADLQPRAGVEVRVDAPEGIGAVTDPELVRHALQNVAANAMKNTFSGEILLQAGISGPEVELEIRDSGRGIGRADLDRAFDRFHRGEGSVGEGFGLGLAIAKDAVEAVGGTITLEPHSGEGVSAKITLPGAMILT